VYSRAIWQLINGFFCTLVFLGDTFSQNFRRRMMLELGIHWDGICFTIRFHTITHGLTIIVSGNLGEFLEHFRLLTFLGFIFPLQSPD
jgi:hypothetical protein